ncbi:MAG: CHAD domain-containing protein [Sulfurospirillaceae bacterium]|nr:CHAD domain-containing protein [Sulfurospirillaceae bacterium]MDD2826144.1 CHAD domain-containing protein [Sulfurospirillaceae bacterium]
MCANGHCLEQNSVKTLLEELLQKTLQNAQAHFEDFTYTLEPESIHQYRVNLRMARSVCKEFINYFTPKHGLFLLDYLKILQKDTNELRDIDVFIECIDDYQAKVKPECLNMCHIIEKKLFKERKKSVSELLLKRNFDKRTHLFDELFSLLRDKKLYRKNAEKNIYKPIQKIIAKRIKKIKKLSLNLSLTTPNAQFHALRLHYKKIRYTTDSACFGDKEHAMKAFSQSFKLIQTALGDVQDKNTQIERLRQHNLKNEACVQQVITMIENELECNKLQCIEQSSHEHIQEIKQTFKAIFA